MHHWSGFHKKGPRVTKTLLSRFSFSRLKQRVFVEQKEYRYTGISRKCFAWFGFAGQNANWLQNIMPHELRDHCKLMAVENRHYLMKKELSIIQVLI